jgi:putative Mg2+ transporter-C (MgtC) family protein
MDMQLAQIGWNLFLAGCLGAATGLERQWRQRMAGLRTNTLVALGAAIFVTYARIGLYRSSVRVTRRGIPESACV